MQPFTKLGLRLEKLFTSCGKSINEWVIFPFFSLFYGIMKNTKGGKQCLSIKYQ